MSGFASWNPQHLHRGGSLTATSALLVLLVVALSACGDSAPSSTSAVDISEAGERPPDDGGFAASDPPDGLALQTLPSVADLVEKIRPSVASISVESLTRGLFLDFTDEGAGSGIVVGADGYVVTNLHVVQSAKDIKVHLPDGRTFQGRIVGQDPISDLAMLKIDAEGLPYVALGSSEGLRVGDWVVAIGNAAALKGGPTVTLGIISGVGRTVATDRGQLYDLIQTDAAINDGNSGGPLVNLAGEVIGINTAILRQAQGIGFAISSSVATPIINSLIENGRVVRPLIGLAGRDLTPAIANELGLRHLEGVIVTRMARDGPAYLAGIRVGNVITEIDGTATPDMARFLTLLWSHEVGDEIRVVYFVENDQAEASVVLAERPR